MTHKGIAKKVLVELADSGFLSQREELEDLLDRYERASTVDREEISKEIGYRCHPKWLGDLNVQSYRWEEWINLLTKLRNQYR